MSLKLIGAMLIVAAGALSGCTAARRLDARAKQIRLLRQMLTSMMQELRSALPLIPELLRQTAAQPDFRTLTFLQEAAANAADFPECWQAALLRDTALSPEERTVLETVGRTLGSTALEAQLAALQLSLERLLDLQKDAEQSARSKGTLCRSMGVLGAVFLAILLV